MKSTRRDPAATSRRRRLAIAGLIVFLIVDIVLVAVAMTESRIPRATSGAPVSTIRPAASERPSPTTSPAPATPAAKPAQAAVADAAAPTRLLAVLDGNTAWRAATGACPATPGVAELTTDGGATWKRSDASGSVGASAIIRLTVQSAKQASAVALASRGCAPEFIRTYVSGDNWAAYAGELASSWYADPGASGRIHSPKGDVAAPCPSVVGLAVGSDTSAAVLCANHDVYRTSDSGAGWGSPQAAPGAVAISALDSGYVVASVGAEGCAGTAVATLDGTTGAPKPVGCAGGSAPAAGTVAISAGSGAMWLWAGDSLVRSTDGGSTWH